MVSLNSSGAGQRNAPSAWSLSHTKDRSKRTRNGLPAPPRCLPLHLALPKVRDNASPVIINQHNRSLHTPNSDLKTKYDLEVFMQYILIMQVHHPLRDMVHAPEKLVSLTLPYLSQPPTKLPPLQYSLNVDHGLSSTFPPLSGRGVQECGRKRTLMATRRPDQLPR
ncbi:hypothetical protein BDR06DRAFT_1015395 [Suillus hirtellus]|nr:hypothetical protein BDR06DRAFT_1015395 [Suillus hirtellus]